MREEKAGRGGEREEEERGGKWNGEGGMEEKGEEGRKIEYSCRTHRH